MDATLTLECDREGDVLYIDKLPPYATQDSDEIGDNVIARFNPTTGAIDNLEVLFFTQRLQQGGTLGCPLR